MRNATLARRVSLGLAALAVAGATWLTPAIALADGPQPGSPWPQFKRDGPRTGAAGVNGPTNPVVAWRYGAGSAIMSGPVIAADGTIYIATENARVVAVRPDGTQKWSYDLPDGGGGAASYLALNGRGQVVFGTQNGFIIGLQTDGNESWRFDTRNAPYGSSDAQAVRAAPGGGPNSGRMYFGTEAGLVYEMEDGAFAGIRRADQDGAVRAGTVITTDGTLIWTTVRGSIYGGALGGGDKWRLVLDGAILATPAFTSDSTVVAVTDKGSVYAINSGSGQQRWRVQPGESRQMRAGPVIGTDGSILVGGDEGRLYALDPATGATRWSFGTLSVLAASPAVAANGLIYLPSNDGNVYVLTAAGQLLSKFQTDSTFDVSSPAIGADGIVYVGTRGSNQLIALKEGTPIAIPASGTAATAATTAAPPAAPAPTTPLAPAGFPFIRCGSGRIYFINPNRLIGDYVSNPAVLGSSPILQTSATVPQSRIDAGCGAGR